MVVEVFPFVRNGAIIETLSSNGLKKMGSRENFNLIE